MKPDPRIRAVARPTNLAYFIQDGPDASAWLDAIIADCFSRDGGRQSLIVPITANGAIPEPYLRWVKSIDPDKAVLAGYDNKELARKLCPLLPGTALDSCFRKRDEPEPHPRVSMDPTPLTAISWLPMLKIVTGWHRPPPQNILDCYPAWRDDGLISDNFGTLQGSHFGFPIHSQVGLAALLLTPKDAPANRWHMQARDAVEINNIESALHHLSRDGTTVTVSMLANLAPKKSVPSHPWSSAFCLVIGDSLVDRISCWNAGLVFGDSQRQSYKTLRVPAAALSSDPYTIAISEFLRAHNSISGANGPAQIMVRSSSLDAQTCAGFVDRLRTSSRSIVDFEAIHSFEDCCPPDPNTRTHTGLFLPTSNDRLEIPLSGTKATFKPPVPSQLTYCSGQHPLFSRGNWSIDVSVDRINDVGRFDNVREAWVLPQRDQLVRSFSDVREARICRAGNISVQVDRDTAHLQINQPTDAEFFRVLLTESSPVSPYDIRAGCLVSVKYEHCELSDKGRYLRGALGIFGGLASAASTLGTHFWRMQLMSMAAPAHAEQEAVVDFLKRRLRAKNGVATIDKEETWQQLAKRVVEKAARLRVPRHVTKYSKLLESWAEELKSAVEFDKNLHRDRDQILAEGPAVLRRSIGYLLDLGVFYRGHEWVCRRCSHRNWVDIDSLRNVVACVVCEHEHLVPVDLELDLQLNEFLATCLREHDTLTVIAALRTIQEASRNSFMFSPQMNLYRKYPIKPSAGPDREVDLLCLSEGQLWLGEAKANVNLITPADIQDLAAAAEAVGADVVVLAAYKGEGAALDGKVRQLQKVVKGAADVRGILAGWDDGPSCFL